MMANIAPVHLMKWIEEHKTLFSGPVANKEVFPESEFIYQIVRGPTRRTAFKTILATRTSINRRAAARFEAYTPTVSRPNTLIPGPRPRPAAAAPAAASGSRQRAKLSIRRREMLWREGRLGRLVHGNQRASSSSSASTLISPPAYVATKPTISWLGKGQFWLPTYRMSFTSTPTSSFTSRATQPSSDSPLSTKPATSA